MGRRKQSKVDKSPFKLRRRKLSDGRESLFIDRTVDGKHEYEFLKLYLVPETSVKAKRENAKTLRQAEEIILAKTEDMVDDKAREEAAKDKSKMPLSDFIDLLMEEYKQRGQPSYRHLRASRTKFEKFYPGARGQEILYRLCRVAEIRASHSAGKAACPSHSLFLFLDSRHHPVCGMAERIYKEQSLEVVEFPRKDSETGEQT